MALFNLTPRDRTPGRVINTPAGVTEQNDWDAVTEAFTLAEAEFAKRIEGITVGEADPATNETGDLYYKQKRVLFSDADFTITPVDQTTVRVDGTGGGGGDYDYLTVVLQADDAATTNAVGNNHHPVPQDGWTDVRLAAMDINPAGAVFTTLTFEYWDGAVWQTTAIDILVDNTDPGVVGAWEALPAGFLAVADSVWIRLLDTGGDADSDIGHASCTFRRTK